jgi:predicted MFS family arabinose efflux permease
VNGTNDRRTLSDRVAVLRNHNYRLLFFATFGSGVGTWMATVALPVAMNRRTDSTWWVTALLVVTFLPGVVVGILAGPLVDRRSRKLLIVTSDVARLIVFAALPFVDSPGGILALAAVAGVANSFFRPAVFAGVPNLLEERELASGMSLLQATDWLAAPLGSILGGTVISAAGVDVVYWINAATFLLSALLLVQIPSRLLQSEQGITRGHWNDLREGISLFHRSPVLRAVLFGFGFAMLGGGLINVAELFLSNRALHSGAFGYGLLWSGTGIGLVAGSILAGSLLEDHESLDGYALVFVPWAVGFLAAAVSPDIWIASLAMVLAGLGNGLTFPMTVVIVQRATADRVRGRAFAVIISVHNALFALGMVVSAELTAAAGPRWTYVGGASLVACGGCTAWALSRRPDPHPSRAGEQAV